MAAGEGVRGKFKWRNKRKKNKGRKPIKGKRKGFKRGKQLTRHP